MTFQAMLLHFAYILLNSALECVTRIMLLFKNARFFFKQKLSCNAAQDIWFISPLLAFPVFHEVAGAAARD